MSSIRFFSVIRGTTEQVRINAGWSRKQEHFFLKMQVVGTGEERLSLIHTEPDTTALARVLEHLHGIIAPPGFWERVEAKQPDDFEFPSEGWTPDICAYCTDTALVPGIVFPGAYDGEGAHAFVQRCDSCNLVVDDMAAAFIISTVLGLPLEYGPKGHPYIRDLSWDEAHALSRPGIMIPAEKPE